MIEKKYEPFCVASVGQTIGWQSAAGYLEGVISKIDTHCKTACKHTLSDYVRVEVDPYFSRFEGESIYLNANALMGGLRARRV